MPPNPDPLRAPGTDDDPEAGHVRGCLMLAGLVVLIALALRFL